MANHVKHSVIPIYLVGMTWLVYALLLPLSSGLDYLICTVVSVVVYKAGKKFF